VEKGVSGRELEVSVFEYQGKIHASLPGEIICPAKFYSYEEKYSKVGQTTTETIAKNERNNG
jgi:D-alanine-D-alanine ligase